MLCHNKLCQNEFEPSTYNQKYCCPKCSNVSHVREWSNKRKKTCLSCNTLIKHTATYCKPCLGKIKSKKYELLTLKDIHNKLSYLKKHPSWLNAEVRAFARSWNPDIVKHPRQKCNYNKHSELAHIKEISSFDENTKLGEINHPSNLLALCPNHHWEFDNNLLKLEDIPSRTS